MEVVESMIKRYREAIYQMEKEECGKIRPIICGHSMKILCMQMQQYMKIFSLTVKKGRRDLGQPGYTSDDH